MLNLEHLMLSIISETRELPVFLILEWLAFGYPALRILESFSVGFPLH